jgi:hypothetical protein
MNPSFHHALILNNRFEMVMMDEKLILNGLLVIS